MKRIEKSVTNLKHALLYQLAQTAFRFVLRTMMVRFLGDAFVGLNSLFTEVIAMLSMAELGVGSAIIYSLYKPLSQKDERQVARLMCLFKRAYQIIALVIFVAGMCLLPWIHLLVSKVDFSVNYLRLVYFLFLVTTCSTYLFSYKSSLLVADQNKYLSTRVNIMVDTGMMAVQIAVLWLWNNFIIFLCVKMAAEVVRNVLITHTANRFYPYLTKKAELPSKEERAEVFKNIRHIFIGKLSGKITNSTDSILISLLDSTLSVGFFSNYNVILSSARTFLLQIPESATGGIGNMLVEETPEYCRSVLSRLTFIQYFIAAVCSSCLISQMTPFVGVWLGKERMLPFSVVLVLTLNFYLTVMREPLWKMISAAGIFQKSKNVSILGSGVNLAVSVALGMRIGMLGVFIGTLCTHLIQVTLMAALLHRQTFHMSPREYLLKWVAWTAVFAASAALGKWVGGLVPIENAIIAIIVRAAISGVATAGAIALVFMKTPEFRYCLKIVKQIITRDQNLGI